MVPALVWPLELAVLEAVRWVPLGDLALPANGDAVQAKPIVNAGASVHGDGSGRQHLKAEELWGQLFQVVGVLEEGEDLFPWPRDEQLGLEAPGTIVESVVTQHGHEASFGIQSNTECA